MQSLTDRMAAVLRSMRESWDINADTFVMPTTTARATVQEVSELLAEYEAERSPPLARAQVGQRVRYLGTLPGVDGGVVIYANEHSVNARNDSGSLSKIRHGLYEIVPNLPATNTGD